MNEMTQARFEGEFSRAKYRTWLVKQDDRTVREQSHGARSRAKEAAPDLNSLGTGLTALVGLWSYGLTRLVLLDASAGRLDVFVALGAGVTWAILLGVLFVVLLPKAWEWAKWTSIARDCDRESARRYRLDREERFAEAVRAKGE